MPEGISSWQWILLAYCLAPIIGFMIIGWILVSIYRVIFGGVRGVAESVASVPRQAIQTAGKVHIASTLANAQLERRRLENPDNYEEVARTRVWVAYALVALIGGPILITVTVLLYAFGIVGGVALTLADVVAFCAYVAYGFHLMDQARKGRNPQRIVQKDARAQLREGNKGKNR